MLHNIDYSLQFPTIDDALAMTFDAMWARSRTYTTPKHAFEYARRRDNAGHDVALAYVPSRGFVVWMH
jgi:hypothetical protein